MSLRRPVVLCILDGWGLSNRIEGNTVAQAATPNFDRVMATCPNATLVTHGPDVGLPSGQMGNSEVGHTNIGAGRVVAMDIGQIDLAIEDGSFAANPELSGFIAALRASGGVAHVSGLVSPGGVHAHQRHVLEAVRVLASAGIPVVVHAITDGRDVPPKSAGEQVAELAAALPAGARIGTVIGRYFAMDRDNRWERVEAAFRRMVDGSRIGTYAGPCGPVSDTAAGAISAAYGRGETDEFIRPTALAGYDGMRDGDGLFFVNFRADRAREILAAFGDPGFAAFDTGPRPKLAARLGMVDYSKDHDRYMTSMFPKRAIVNTLGEWVALNGLRQFRLAETEKYPHVTFFLNGGREEPFSGESRHMAQSPKVATYDLAPEMAAEEVTLWLLAAIAQGHDLVVVNYANPDMVGHTGDIAAAIRACEFVDARLGTALAALEEAGGTMLLTADHGNCEVMIDPETGGPHTAHTLSPVPVVLIGGPAGARLRGGRLADVAPTVLELLGLALPPEMTGRSLIVMP
jgi:2,3-bisphosphoglycerate-independent phosphoglycerate mutase